MPERKKSLRREFLVYPRFQLYLVVVNCFVLMAMAGFLGFSAKASFAELNHVGVSIHLYKTHPFFGMVEAEAHHFYSRLVLALVACIVVSSGIILFASHKVVGPIIRLKNYFKNIERRERAPKKALRFRRGDCFEDLPSSINSAITILRAGPAEEETTSVTRKYRLY